MAQPRRILIVRTDRIGDVVLATPLIRALRRSFPDAYLAALVRPYTRDVLLHNPHLNDLLVDDPDREHAGRAGFWKQVRMLRSQRFDTALLLLPTERLAWMLFLAGIRRRIGVGTRFYQVLTFMRTVSRHKYVPLRHEADYCLDLGRAIGATDDGLRPKVVVTEEERKRALAVLEQRGISAGSEGKIRLIGIHPGHGHSAPNWRPERYAELVAGLLAEPDIRIVITGGAGDRPLMEPFGLLDPARVVDLVGMLNVRELVGVISHVDVLVSASTGPMHIAAGLGVPTVSLFCPLTACSPSLWGPLGNRSDVVLPPEGYCRTRCPGDPHICDLEDGVFPADVCRRVLSMTRSGG
jgi:ADP-heptose:LPS heptosyltransferase